MKLKIHMKSGKTLIQRNVKDWDLTYNNTMLTQLNIELHVWGSYSIIMSSLDLSSIEAITKH